LGQSITPLEGQSFVGVPGAVLVGNGAAFAFRSNAEDVTIEGLEVTGYEPESRDAVIHLEDGATGWIIRNNEVHDNAETGIRVRNGAQVLNNSIHHNGRYGLTGSGAEILVEGNEIVCNANVYGATGDSGATKFVHTVGLILRGNSVRHNFGNGLWIDINNENSLVEDNELVGNELAGVFVEISCGAMVRANRLTQNGFGSTRPNTMEHAAIFVSDSPNVDVFDNRMIDNAKGIGAIQWAHENRGAVDRCEPELRNLHVHANWIEQAGGLAAGVEATTERDHVWADWGNRFEGNEYDVGQTARFRWEGQTLTRGEWAEPMGSS
jgi:nitrous oxidase accessory protein NosD